MPFSLSTFHFHFSLSTFHFALGTLEMETQASRIHRQRQSQHFIPSKRMISFVLPTVLMIFRKPFLFQQPFLLLWAPHGNNAKLQLRTLHFTKVFQHVLMETRSSAQDLHGARAVNRNRSLLGNCDFDSFPRVLKDSEKPFLFLETVPSEQQVPVLETQGISMVFACFQRAAQTRLAYTGNTVNKAWQPSSVALIWSGI